MAVSTITIPSDVDQMDRLSAANIVLTAANALATEHSVSPFSYPTRASIDFYGYKSMFRDMASGQAALVTALSLSASLTPAVYSDVDYSDFWTYLNYYVGTMNAIITAAGG